MHMGREKGPWPMPAVSGDLSVGILNIVKPGGVLRMSVVMLTGGVLIDAPLLARPGCTLAEMSF